MTIAQLIKSRTPKFNTHPEQAVQSLLEELGYNIGPDFLPKSFTSQASIPIGEYSFRPDFLIEGKIWIEVDGPHHFTERNVRKDFWKDQQILEKGYKLIRIDYQLTERKKLRALLKGQLINALNSSKDFVRLVG